MKCSANFRQRFRKHWSGGAKAQTQSLLLSVEDVSAGERAGPLPQPPGLLPDPVPLPRSLVLRGREAERLVHNAIIIFFN